MIIDGKAMLLGDNIDTDAIIPGRYLTLVEPSEIARHLFEGVDHDFAKRFKKGDILVVGKNFGSGSSREHAAIGLKHLGVGCIVAKSFARIFFRNAINVGLPILVCQPAVENAHNGSHVHIDSEKGIVRIDAREFEAGKFPAFLTELIGRGGLVEWVREELLKESK